MTSTILTSLLLALGATNALASLQHAPAVHHPHRRVVGGQLQSHQPRAAKAHRHEYLLQNSTLTSKVQARDSQGRATFYHPATEGGAQSSCGDWMNDNTMGVALSTPGWKYFADQGISQQDLCYKSITIHGIFGDQKAKIYDECPPDSSSNTCGNICDIDLTYGLFGMLANYALGIFPVHWSFDDGTPSPCGPAGAASSSQSAKHHPTSTSSSSSWSSPSSSSSHEHKSAGAHLASKSASPSASPAQASNSPKNTYSTQLQWWDDINPEWCPGINTPDGTVTVAVGPSEAYPNDKLADTCGKWITIKADDKQIQAQVVEWVPDTTENFLAVGTAYQSIISSGSGTVSWGYNN